MNIGKQIKDLRLGNQLTQEELAVRAGVTKGFISLLERDKSSVSLETLSEVLAVLGESLSSFFSVSTAASFVFGKQNRVAINNQAIDKFQLLIPGSTTMAMEPCLLTLAPQQKLWHKEPHNGEEFGYVIRGRVSIGVGRRAYTAKAGECFSYKSQQEHFVLNVGRSPAEVLLVTWPPQF